MTTTEAKVSTTYLKEGHTMKIHKSITALRAMEACERQMTSLDNPGFCIVCGEEADGCEPDAMGRCDALRNRFRSQ